jgi:hypothetical protein
LNFVCVLQSQGMVKNGNTARGPSYKLFTTIINTVQLGFYLVMLVL